jgi:maleate cis-trans isomerase
MKRLGILYPPCGAEFEYYRYGERLDADVRISLMGVRIDGGDDEHAPEHLSRTGALENLELSGRVLARVEPDAACWACTSGSFVDGLGHARAQAEALTRVLGCPATSTSLAFVAALEHLGITAVSILASYPERTAERFFGLLADSGIRTHAYRCLDIDSGPAAADLELDAATAASRKLEVPDDGALLIPDTAIPTMHWIEPLERELGRPVLTANQASLWETARLAGITPSATLPGHLFHG